MGKNIFYFLISLLIIAALALIAAFGVTIGSLHIPNALDPDKGIRKGLDLAGGSVITFEAQVDNNISQSELDENMSVVQSMLRQRLTYLGFSEATLSKVGSKRIRVEIPSVQNPEEAVQMLGSTAKLQFVDSEGNVVISGTDIVSAKAMYGQVDPAGDNENYIQLKISKEAVKKFAEATKRVSQLTGGKNYIAIMMDDKTLSSPTVDKEISTDSPVIVGKFTGDEAKNLANLISSGALPFSLKEVQMQSVGPLLGEQALSNSLLAGGIGVLLVLIFMLVMYRLPGLMSDIALICYIAIVLLILTALRTNLTLPGIAGIILSIGMAVDANVVIFERMKEELRMGKTVKAAVKSGFHRAFTAIFDSNITTIIAAAVLWYFGTGTIQNFAQTLFLGVVVSMFTAIVVTRFLLNRLVNMNVKNIKLYGA